jgi:hypothetical protein
VTDFQKENCGDSWLPSSCFKKNWKLSGGVGLILFVFLFLYPDQSSKGIILDQFDRQLYSQNPVAFAGLFWIIDILTNGNLLGFEIIFFGLLSILWAMVALRWATLLKPNEAASAWIVFLVICNPMALDFHVLASRHSYSLALFFLAASFARAPWSWWSACLLALSIGFHYSTLPLVLLFFLFRGWGEFLIQRGKWILAGITIISFVALALFRHTRLAESIPDALYKKQFISANLELVNEYQSQTGQPWSVGFFNHESHVQWFYLGAAFGVSWLLLRIEKQDYLGPNGVPMMLAALGCVIIFNAYPGSNRFLYAVLIPGMIYVPMMVAQQLEHRIKWSASRMEVFLVCFVILIVNLMVYT